MSSKKGPGRFVAAHQTEAARRALIQPVPCWEYKWVIPPGMPSGSTLRLRQWEFSDDEDESQAPLAPLPDEPEPDQGDEEEEDEEKEDSAPVPSGLATPLPAETSMRGVPGLDTPISGALTPSITEAPPVAINLANRLRASENKPHPLASSFGPDDMEAMEVNENVDTTEADNAVATAAEQGIMEGEPSLLDSINMDMGVVDMDALDESTEAYMDMLNSGALDLGDDLMNGSLGEPPM